MTSKVIQIQIYSEYLLTELSDRKSPPDAKIFAFELGYYSKYAWELYAVNSRHAARQHAQIDAKRRTHYFSERDRHRRLLLPHIFSPAHRPG